MYNVQILYVCVYAYLQNLGYCLFSTDLVITFHRKDVYI